MIKPTKKFKIFDCVLISEGTEFDLRINFIPYLSTDVDPNKYWKEAERLIKHLEKIGIKQR